MYFDENNRCVPVEKGASNYICRTTDEHELMTTVYFLKVTQTELMNHQFDIKIKLLQNFF